VIRTAGAGRRCRSCTKRLSLGTTVREVLARIRKLVTHPIPQLVKRRTIKETTKVTPDRLGSYLAAAAGLGGLAATAEAAVVQLDVSSISGANAGLVSGGSKAVSLGSLGSDLEGNFAFYHQNVPKYSTDQLTGLSGTGGAMIAAGTGATSPTNFAARALIGADTPFSGTKYNTVFVSGSHVSPDFGPDSFIGFKSADGHYGWLEVTWDSAAGNFEILDGAYQNVAGATILAGTAVPEPAGVLGTLGLLAGGTFFRRRKQAA
jgi:hypothetical protein